MGLPDCITNVSSFSIAFSASTMAFKAVRFLATFPLPPYATRSFGFFAISGSRQFKRRRKSPSCYHPLQDILLPLGDL